MLLVVLEGNGKEIERKRNSASSGISYKGRVRKVAKWKPSSDDESDDEDPSSFLTFDYE